MTGDDDEIYVHELDVTSELVRQAGELVESIRGEGFVTTRKVDHSPVTRADTASDALIRSTLAAAFPDDAILSEESNVLTEGTSRRTWVIDPLDGTRGFVAGTEDYAVQVGLLVDDRPVLGVVFEPASGRLYRAASSWGATVEEPGTEPKTLSVSDRQEASSMPMVTSSSLSGGSRREILDATGLRDGGTCHSVGVKVGRVVRGVADVYYSSHPVSYWDSCAPLVILQESGGVLTDLGGRPLAYDLSRGTWNHQGSFVASNGRLHAATCDAIRAVQNP